MRSQRQNLSALVFKCFSERAVPSIMRRFAPKAEGGFRSLRSIILRLSRPIVMLRWWRTVSRITGESEGRGGIAWAARFGVREVERGSGGET